MSHILRLILLLPLLAHGHAAMAETVEHPTRLLAPLLFSVAWFLGPVIYFSLPVLCLAGIWLGLDRVTKPLAQGQGRPWWGYPLLAACLLVGFIWSSEATVLRHGFWPGVALGLLIWHGLERWAGRPGLSLRRILGLKGWRRWVVPVALVLLGWWAVAGARTGANLVVAVLNAPELGTPPYRVADNRDFTPYTLAALRRFPDAQSCLKPGADAARPGDLFQMDWDRIERDEEANVCLFRLLAALGSMDRFTAFAEAQGFGVSDSGFNPEFPFVERDGSLRVTAGWSISANGPRYPTTGLSRFLLAVPYGMSVDATWAADRTTLLWVRIGFSTL